MKFIKTNQLVTLGHALAQFVQGVHRALHGGELAVNLAHEFVKVQTGFALNRHSGKKAVHQKALAPAHAAKHVDTFGNLRAGKQLAEEASSLGLVGRPLSGTTLQSVNGSELCGIALVITLEQLSFVNFTNGHGHWTLQFK
jgi:hypothetical protein